MSRVLIYSRFFPAYHTRAGEPTYFVEKLWGGWADQGHIMDDINFGDLPVDFHVYYNAGPKWHTIRAGKRWKVGDVFSPRTWSGKAYRSPMIIIGPDIEVKKVWDIEIATNDQLTIEGKDWRLFDVFNPIVAQLAENDGLCSNDLVEWFPNSKHFSGQIICWSDKIDY